MIFKKDIRILINQKRKTYNTSVFSNLNKKFYKNFLNNKFLTSIKNNIIAGYFSFEFECNLSNILKYYYTNNKISLPVIKEKNKKMIFREWDCLNNTLQINDLFKKMNIFEPNFNCEQVFPNICFVPAVAIDIYGNRVGYGEGYYDKTLQNINCLKIAIIFDFQLFKEELENNKNDIKMDYILTEKEFIKID